LVPNAISGFAKLYPNEWSVCVATIKVPFPAIKRLLTLGGPSTILGFVISIIVDPIE
jgi:hypothetical protein